MEALWTRKEGAWPSSFREREPGFKAWAEEEPAWALEGEFTT